MFDHMHHHIYLLQATISFDSEVFYFCNNSYLSWFYFLENILIFKTYSLVCDSEEHCTAKEQSSINSWFYRNFNYYLNILILINYNMITFPVKTCQIPSDPLKVSSKHNCLDDIPIDAVFGSPIVSDISHFSALFE